MKEISSEARDLVRLGRRMNRPTLADRARISDALRARLGDAAFQLDPSDAIKALGPARSPWMMLSGFAVGAAVLGGGLFLALRPHAEATRAAPAALSAPRIAPAAPAPVDSLPGEERSLEVRSAKAAPSEPSVTRRTTSTLAQEVAILSRATSALHSGRPQDALVALSEHQSKFRNGILSEERRAARAQALCALGRRSEAEAELARLARTSPGSPQAARARQACNARN